MTYLGNWTVTIYRKGAPVQGAYGDKPGPETSHTISGCLVQSLKGLKYASAEEVSAASDSILSHYLVHLPAGSDIVATDQATIPGIPYRMEVSGDPGLEPNPDGTIDHIEAFFARYSGGA